MCSASAVRLILTKALQKHTLQAEVSFLHGVACQLRSWLQLFRERLSENMCR